MSDWAVFEDGTIRRDGQEMDEVEIVQEIKRLQKALDDLIGYAQAVLKAGQPC